MCIHNEKEGKMEKQIAKGGRISPIPYEIIEIPKMGIARNSILNKGSSDKCVKIILNTNSPTAGKMLQTSS